MSSAKRRGGLGRGLGALIPTSAPAERTHAGEVESDEKRGSEAAAVPGDVPVAGLSPVRTDEDGSPASAEPVDRAKVEHGEQPGPVPGASFAELPVAVIHPNPKQPRQVFDEDALAELTHSIREFGVLQPVVVRPDRDGYELVMGERRLRAAVAAGLVSIPAIVRSTSDDAMLRDALLENIHRAQLNPLEEAAAYQQLLEEFGATHDELAQRIGRSRPQVSNTIRLLHLPLAVQRRVAAGVLSAGHARALLSLDDGEQQDELAGRIVAEGLSVRATEELVALAQHGGAQTKAHRSSPSKRITAPAVAELADKLSDAFDTRVRVDIGRRKGKITVEFASIDDLERIVALMAPQVATRVAAGQPGDGPAPSAEPNEP